MSSKTCVKCGRIHSHSIKNGGEYLSKKFDSDLMGPSDQFPTDGLNFKEQQDAVSIVNTFLTLNNIIFVPDEDRYDKIVLVEPPKTQVKSFMIGGPKPIRKAKVTFWKQVTDVYTEFIVNLYSKNIESSNIISDARPSWTCSDESRINILAFSNQEFRNALKRRKIYSASSPGGKRQITDDDINTNIYLDVALDGRRDAVVENLQNINYFNALSEKNNRRFYFSAYWNSGNQDTVSSYIHPIEGIIGIVDLVTNTVVIQDEEETVDFTAITDQLDWKRNSPYTLKNFKSNYSPSFTVNGTLIQWGPWKLRWRFDPTYGLNLGHIEILDPTSKADGVVWRKLIYKLGITEFLTIYGGPDVSGSVKSFFDIGEYQARDYVPPLMPGIDVPIEAHMLNSPITSENGTTLNLSNVASIHEEDAGCAVRHVDYPCSGKVMKHGARNRKLVLTTNHTIANYDYIISYSFDLNGKININVKATGLMECSGTADSTIDNLEYSSLVHKNVIAPNHYHVFNVRTDWEIDASETETKNSVELSEVVAEKDPNKNPFGNAFKEIHGTIEYEKDILKNEIIGHDGDIFKTPGLHNFDNFRTWTIISENSRINDTNIHRGYQIIPQPVSKNLMNPDARISKRTMIPNYNMVVTKYKDDEQICVGNYPCEVLVDQNVPITDKGLRTYIEDNECIINEDIVTWYSTGFGHSPHREQYPIMPVEEVNIGFHPHNFFTECPSMYIPGFSTQGKFPNTF